MTRRLFVYEGGKLTFSKPLFEDETVNQESVRANYRKRIALRVRRLKNDPESIFHAAERSNAEFRFRLEVEAQSESAGVTPFRLLESSQRIETHDASQPGRKAAVRAELLKSDCCGIFHAAESSNELYRKRLSQQGLCEGDNSGCVLGMDPTSIDECSHPLYQPGVAERVMRFVGLFRPSAEELVRAYEIVREQIPAPLASLGEVQRIDALTKSAIWVYRRRGIVVGCLATLALTRAGRDALIEGGFSPRDIKEHWVAKIGDPLAGFYCWSYAGIDLRTRRKLARALKTLVDQDFPELPFFGREATEGGARVMSSLGFIPVKASPDLYWRCRSVMAQTAA